VVQELSKNKKIQAIYFFSKDFPEIPAVHRELRISRDPNISESVF